jgi:hypothetical protein
MEQRKRRGERLVLATMEDVREAVSEITAQADRTLAILTHDLEPDIYDHDDFLERLKRFVLARPFARVRVLIADPVRAMKDGNRFVTMGRRLNSYIEFRHVKPQYRNHPEAFCIADDYALVYRARADSWEGVADTHEPTVARRYLDMFDELWHACEVEPEQKQLHV